MTTTSSSAASDPLIQRLADDGFGDPWNYAERAAVVAAIWTEAGGTDRLVSIAGDRAAPIRSRLVACEVVFERERKAVDLLGGAVAAEVYARALAENLTGMANSWGLLWEYRDEGPLGIRFLMIGDDAIPALRPLLADERESMRYVGSEEATVGNAQHYRIKDYAAYYLSKILHVQLPYRAERAERDREIAELAATLPPP